MSSPSRQRRLFATASILALLAGCSSSPNSEVFVKPGGLTGSLVNAAMYPLDKTVYWMSWTAVAYLVLDPWAPNWEIEEARFPENHIHLQLAMKRYTAGGAGEARAVFHRRAKDLMRAGGFAGYEVVEYAEGMESSMLGAKRTATGIVRFTGKTASSG